MTRQNNQLDKDRLAYLNKHYSPSASDTVIIVSVNQQRLFLFKAEKLIASYPVSTAIKGCGNLSGSFQTPPGTHCIAEKIGADAPINSIFKGRINTGNIAKIITDPDSHSKDDIITTRILWLKGLEPGINKGGNIDSYQRYIYIHGTNEEGRLGSSASHGCIRMGNQDVIELFEQVSVGTLVEIMK